MPIIYVLRSPAGVLMLNVTPPVPPPTVALTAIGRNGTTLAISRDGMTLAIGRDGKNTAIGRNGTTLAISRDGLNTGKGRG